MEQILSSNSDWRKVHNTYNFCYVFVFQYSKYPSSIAALSFSRDGRLLAAASSYTFEEGDKP